MKLFVSSDIHSAYTPWITALKQAGFDEHNPEHKIILCGDAFDRMDESEEVFMFIMDMVSKNKIILIKGNHDLLLEECCKRGFFYKHDVSNGTVKTINDIGGASEGRPFDDCCRITLNRTERYRELLLNYFETKKYIFVHSWIPTDVHFEGSTKPWYQQGKTHAWMDDWRNGNEVEWEEAMWGNPFSRANADLNQTGKTIVFGHWHCSAGHAMLSQIKTSEYESEGIISEFEDDAIWEPCYFKNTIGIDRCVSYTGQVNVLVLEDELIDDYN